MCETLVKTEEFKDSSWESVPSGWQAYSISELMNYIKSGLSRAINFDDIGVPVITSTNLVDGELNTTDLKYWYEKDPQGANIADYILDDGDILLNFINSVSQIGKVCIFRDLSRPAIYTTNIFRIKPNNKVTTKFFWRLLQSNHVQHWIQLITKPAINQASFTQPEFAAIPVVVPESKEEQECITEILDTVDEAIARTSSLIAKLKQMKAGLLHDLLTQGLDENGELRDAIAHPEQFKDSPLGQIPKGWEVGELCDFYAVPARNGLYKPAKFYGQGVLMIHMPQMFRGLTIDVSDAARVDVNPSELERFELIAGDLVFARRSLNLEGAGRCSLVPGLPEPTTFESSIIRVRLSAEKLRPVFANYFLNSEIGFRLRLPLIRQVAVSGVSSEDIASIPVPCPLPEEQDAIVEIINTHNTCIRTEEAYRDKLKLQKQGLMQDLLTGRVQV